MPSIHSQIDTIDDIFVYTYHYPENNLHPIEQLKWANSAILTKHTSILTNSPYIYEAIIRRCDRERLLLIHYYNGVQQDSGNTAFTSFSEPFIQFDKEDSNKLQSKGSIMNKKLIKQYREEFNHWLNGGLFLWYFDHTWDNDEIVWYSEKYANAKVIIDDEYVEFRKALAEGKTIQYINLNTDAFKNWQDLENPNFNPNFEYRIKPEGSRFKVGDWVVYKGGGYCDGEILQITDIDERDFCTFGNYNKLYHFDKLRLWKPKPGEWCWVFDIKGRIPLLRKFVCVDNESNTSFKYIVEKYDGIGTATYRCIEPFIGQLPTYIKDSDES